MKIAPIVLFSLVCSACTVRCMRIEPSTSVEEVQERQARARKAQQRPSSPDRPVDPPPSPNDR